MGARSFSQEDIIRFSRDIETARALLIKQKSDDNIILLAQKQAAAAEAYLLLGDVEESKRYFSFAQLTLKQAENPETTSEVFERIGKVFARAGKHSDASGYFLLAVKTRETLPPKTPEQRIELAQIYKISADSLTKTGHIDDAIALLTKRADMLRKSCENTPILSDIKGLADALYDLGSSYEHYEAYEVSMKFYTESLSLYNLAEKEYNADTRRETANTIISIGGIYELTKDYDTAFLKYKEALEINRRLAVRDGDEQSLKHLAASCTHTAELCETMGNLVEALALFREKTDVNLRLSKLKPVISPPEVLFLNPPEDFIERLERFESKLPWYSLLFEMEENPSRDKMYITYFTMGRLTEELARQHNDNSLLQDAMSLFEASEAILNMVHEEFPEKGLESNLREVKSSVKKIKNRINQGGTSDE